MTSPDSDAADQNSESDDAVWRDLVARLQGGTPQATDAPVPGTTPDGRSATSEHSGEGPGGHVPAEKNQGDQHPPAALFQDFDPLGLAAPHPERSPDGPAPANPRDYVVEDENDEGIFTPEDPVIFAGAEPKAVLAWAGAVGGPLALVLIAMFWRSAPLTAVLGLVAIFIVSVVYLISRLPQEKDETDNGARL